jgi:hypothetical protein
MIKMENNKWQPHEDFIEYLLNLPEKFIWVDKLPQVGLTTSLGKVCLRKGLTFAHFAPTNRIIDDTLGKRIMEGKPFGRIGSNEYMCTKSYKNEFFGFHHSGGCTRCLYFYDSTEQGCGYRSVIDNPYPAYGLTYSKFRILTYVDPFAEAFFEGRLSPEKLAKLDEEEIYKLDHSMAYFRWSIKKILFEKSDIILLDEFARLIAFQPPGFFVSDLSNAVREINVRLTYKIKNKVRQGKTEEAEYYKEVSDMLNEFSEGIREVSIDKSKGYGVYKNEHILDLILAGEIGSTSLKALNELRKAAMKTLGLKEGDKDIIKIMQNVMISMTYPELWVINKVKKDTDDIEPYAFSNVIHPFYDVLKPYLENYKGKIIATGMMLPAFETLPWKMVTMPDFNNTEAMHLVVCDTKKLWFRRKEYCTEEECAKFENWSEHKEKTKDLILNMKKKFKNLNVIVFAFNRDVYKELNSWKKEIIEKEPLAEGILIEKSYCFTYYRSELGSGVNLSSYPIKFYLGAADTPQDAYSESELLYGLPQDEMRHMEIADTFMNTLGRGKDPEGKLPSISFGIGARKEDVLDLIPKDKQEHYNIVSAYTEGTIYDACNIFADYWFIHKIRGNKFSLDDLPKIVDIFKAATEKRFTTIRQIQGRWSNKLDKPNADEIRRLCRYLPANNFEFDGRTIRNKGFFKE